MGVKGLQTYIEQHCPDACIPVRLDQEAKRYAEKTGRCPVMVADGLGCLRKLYPPDIPWVYGGQWREYMARLNDFLAAFHKSGIELVFVFDGVIDNAKRTEWAKRRRNVNKDIAKIFNIVKTQEKQPDSNFYQIPAALGTFTKLALKSLGATVLNSVIDADQEIASYCYQHNCFAILGEDTDFIIYDSAPVYSIKHLRLERKNSTVSTVLYSRDILCQSLGLSISQLPLLSTLTGNDYVAVSSLNAWHSELVACAKKQNQHPFVPTIIPSVANYITTLADPSDLAQVAYDVFRDRSKMGLLETSLDMYRVDVEGIGEEGCIRVSKPPKVISRFIRVENEIASHRHVRHQQDSQRGGQLTAPSNLVAMKTLARIDPCVLQLARRRHVRVENTTAIFNILCNGIMDCSNSLEDETNPEIPPQALVYKTVRQRMYGVLYGVGLHEYTNHERNGGRMDSKKARSPESTDSPTASVKKARTTTLSSQHADSPKSAVTTTGAGRNAEAADQQKLSGRVVHEWFVHTGNSLTEAELVQAVPLSSMPGACTPKLETLWLSSGDDLSELRMRTFLECMGCMNLQTSATELSSHLLVFCSVLHLLINRKEDAFIWIHELHAFIAQASCLQLYDVNRLRGIHVPKVDARAVQLASMFVRGTAVANDVNCACGWAFPVSSGVPWHYFDGKLFHAKYLEAKAGAEVDMLCDRNDKALKQFQLLKRVITQGTNFEGT